MNVQYKWLLLYGGTVNVEVHPVYKDDLAKEYQLETGQMFFRGKLSGKINLVGVDADYIINAPFYTEFNLLIQKKTDVDSLWQDYYQCRFFKTDCTINEDNRLVSVQPTTVDAYNDVMNGLEKEYNLMELPLVVNAMQAEKRPMIQVYAENDNIVTCISAGQSFDTDRINDSVSPTDCHFAEFASNLEINLQTDIDELKSPFIGLFRNKYIDGQKFYNIDNTYYINYFEYNEQGSQSIYWNGLEIIRTVDNEVMWEFSQVQSYDPADLPSTVQFHPASGHSSLPNISANLFLYKVYARLVCEVEQFEITGTTYNTYKIPSDDIVANNRNYHYCLEYPNLHLQQSNRYSDEPTKWGRNDAGLYFMTPNDTSTWVPVGRSQWVNSSVWTLIDITMDVYETAAKKEFTIKDAYPISSVISALLKKVAPIITHDDAPEYSHFFYDDTVASGIASLLNNTRPHITPKSNILIGEYQQPAQKAPCTLKTIFDMLKNVYGCYWYIDSSYRLVIEHLSWFKNGGSYNSSPSIGFDLTSLENLPNGKKWAFATSEYTFDKQDMPSRYQYAWMDSGTLFFDGNPINILSPFVLQDKVEEVNIANFTSDVSYMLLSPESCSKDGFALLQARYSFGFWKIPILTVHIGTTIYYIQNYFVSMRWLQRNLLTYDMPSWSISIDDTATTAAGIKRGKKQEIVFPVGTDDPNLMQLVKTYIGNGQFEKVTINLSSRSAKVTLKYNTYDN